VPRHVARLVTRPVALLVVDYSASCRLVVDYFTYAARLGASARRATNHSSSTTSHTPRVWMPRHVARLIARRRQLRLAQARCGYSASRRLVVGYSASRRLVVDYSAYASCLGASARHAAHRSSSTTPRRAGSSRGSLRRSSSTASSTPRIRVPRHIARPVTRLIIDYSVRRDFVLRPRWIYFSHAVRRDYLSRGNTGSNSSTSRVATTSSSGHIASTIHLD
jgi:hypothetical protein